jgi:hypothetical protein
MTFTRRIAVWALSAAIILPSVAQAACTQSNATGKWQAIASVFRQQPMLHPIGSVAV